MEIFIAKSGSEAGPFTDDQIKPMHASGMLELTDSVWHQGLPGWIPVHEFLNIRPPLMVNQKNPGREHQEESASSIGTRFCPHCNGKIAAEECNEVTPECPHCSKELLVPSPPSCHPHSSSNPNPSKPTSYKFIKLVLAIGAVISTLAILATTTLWSKNTSRGSEKDSATIERLLNRLEACHSIHADTAKPVYVELKQMIDSGSSIENVAKSINWISNQQMNESIDQCAREISNAMTDYEYLSVTLKFDQELTDLMHVYDDRMFTHTRFIENPSMEAIPRWMNSYQSEERIYTEIVRKLNSYR